MSLLFPIPDWLLDPSGMKDDFGMKPEQIEAAFKALELFHNDVNTAERNAQKQQLNNDLLTVSGDIKAKCEAYNTNIDQGDEILQARLNCDDFNDVTRVFSGEVANFQNIQNQLATIDNFDVSQFIPTLTELNIDKGIIKAHKKLLRKFILHIMINGAYIWVWALLPFKIDLGKEVSQTLSVVAGVAQLLLVISALMGGFFPPFGWFTVPLPMCLKDSTMTHTCEELYYSIIKPYNKAHKEYIKKLSDDAVEYSSNENTQERINEYNQIKDSYEAQLKSLIASIEAQIKELEAKLLADLSVQQEQSDEIFIGQEQDFGLGNVVYSGECFNGIISETDKLYAYASGAVDLIQENTDKIVFYNDVVRKNITKSYEEFLNYKQASEDAIIDAQTFSGIVADSGIVTLSEKYNALYGNTGVLMSLNKFDSGVLTKSIDLIFNTTNTDEIKNFIMYYEDYTTIAEKNNTDVLIKAFKPYTDTPEYNVSVELTKLIDEIGTDFSTQRNNFNTFTMFAQHQIDYVISRVAILEYPVNAIVNSLQAEVDDLKAQLNAASEQNKPPIQSQLDAILQIYNTNKEVQNKLTRLRIYYEKKTLQYLIDTKKFDIKIIAYQGTITGLFEVDDNGNLVEKEVDYTGPVDLQEEEQKYINDKKEFDDLVQEKYIAIDFTASIKNFAGSTNQITSGNRIETTSKFEADYNQIIYLVDKLNKADTETQSAIDVTLNKNKEVEKQASEDAILLASKAESASNNIKYTYSKSIVLQLIKKYMTQEDEVNKKIDDRTKFLNNEITRLNTEIASLNSTTGQGDEAFLANQENKKREYQLQIATYQNELDNMPEKLNLDTYYLNLMCSPLAKLQAELNDKKAQLAAGINGFKPFKIPIDPFDELYNGCYAIVKSYMKHIYLNFKMLVPIFAFSIPFYVVAKFEHGMCKEEFIKRTAKEMAEDIKNSDNSGVFDEIVGMFVGNKLKKHLSTHMIRYSQASPVVEPIPNPMFWIGAPPFIPPFVMLPTFLIVPGILSKGYIL